MRSGFRSKPPAGAQINWGHPLAHGLVDAVLFNEQTGRATRSLTLGDYTTSTGTVSWRADKHGTGRHYSGGARDKLADHPARKLVGAVSILQGVVSDVASTGDWTELANRRAAPPNGACEWGFNFRNAGGVGLQFLWSGGGAYQVVTGSGATLTQYEFTTIGGTRAATGTSGKVFKDGRLVGSNSGLGAPVASTTPITFGAIADGSEPFTGRFHFCYVWSRELSPVDIAYLSADPYAILAPQSPTRRWLYVQPPASIFGPAVLSAPLAQVAAAGEIPIAGSSALSAPLAQIASEGAIPYTGPIAVSAPLARMAAEGTVAGAGGTAKWLALLGVG